MSEELLTPKYQSLGDLFTDRSKRFNVPYYQRPYSWDEVQIDELWKDLITSYDLYRPEIKHDKNSVLYIGNMVIKQNQNGNYDVIDGQQRITTFSLLFLAIYSIMHNYPECSDAIAQIRPILWFEVLRKPQKDQRIIELGSEIDQEILRKLFDKAFDEPKEILVYANSLLDSCSNSYQIKIIKNFIHIYNLINKKFDDSSSIDKFYCFLIDKVHLICITIDETQKENKAIAIFDSINSKGKQLEDIDSIKCWIFSKFNEEEYSIYLKKWGDLIVATNDKVSIYLNTFIKALVKPSLKGNITYSKFKKIDDEIMNFFRVDTIGDAYKKLLECMIQYKQYYQALTDWNVAKQYIKGSKLSFFYTLFTVYRFVHLYPMFFKLFIVLEKQNKLDDYKVKMDDYSEVFIEAIKTLLIVSRIFVLDTDSAGKKLSEAVCTKAIKETWFDKDLVLKHIHSIYSIKKINIDQIGTLLLKSDFYSAPVDKKMAAGLLELYESWDGNNSFSWDQARLGVHNHGSEGINLDHILVQHPKKYPEKEKLLMYAENGNGKKTILILKPGHDFNERDENGNLTVYNGMPYDDFLSIALNRLGNLKTRGGDDNRKASNKPHSDFVTWSKMVERNEYICSFIKKVVFDVDLSKNQSKENESFKLDVSKYDFLTDNKILKPISISFGDGSDDVPTSAWTDVERNLMYKAAAINPKKLIELSESKERWFKGFMSNDLNDFNQSDIECKKISHVLNEKIHFKLFNKQQDVLRYCVEVLKQIGFDINKLSIVVKEK